MRIFLTGATGFIGRALTQALHAHGHELIAWVRDPSRAELPSNVALLSLEGDDTLREAVDGCDAVINLAGEPLVGRRWTAERRRRLHGSRVDLTRRLSDAINAAKTPPRIFISGSAIGYYGDCGATPVDESSARGDDYLATLCGDWETAALSVNNPQTRVALLRTGVVLGKNGGALKKMLPAFRMGFGGRLGSGDQYMSWIHLDDIVALIETLLTDARYQGPVNAVAPNALSNSDFTKALAKALGRPAFFPAPAPVLRALFGEASAVLLTGQRVAPVTALTHGFHFKFADLKQALNDCLA